jgi:hypothetical protein
MKMKYWGDSEMNTKLLEQAKLSKLCLISVMGPHAGESTEEIFVRKIDDINSIGWTIWLINSRGAKVEALHEICNGVDTSFIIFISPSVPGGARPATTAKRVKEYSADNIHWETLPTEMGAVTGNINKMTCGLVLDQLDYYGVEEINQINNLLDIDLSVYCDPRDPKSAIRTMQGNSTVCAIKTNEINLDNQMVSVKRRIIGVGRIKHPHSVWLRKHS